MGTVKIGDTQEVKGMEVSAYYMPSVDCVPNGFQLPAHSSDIYLAVDVRALKDNPNGFANNVWVPYLDVSFEISKSGQAQTVRGTFLPVFSCDGPAYGDNVRLFGNGKYNLTLVVSPPSDTHIRPVLRNVDKKTGVPNKGEHWFEPFGVHLEFVYQGTGKAE
ncbi:iron transporter [Nonomuraea angiospora]|uniref:iron transporter n=1 Tax=Nonomuraea angiospora TaxID=46172 RepID=UPI00344E1BC2